MTIDYSMTLYLLLFANAALASAAVIAILRFQKRSERLEKFWSSPTGAAIADQQSTDIDRSLALSTLRLERRLVQLQATLDGLAASPGDSEPQPPPAQQLPIENAIRMARSGASVEDLSRSCGLNIGEARLLKKMHGAAA